MKRLLVFGSLTTILLATSLAFAQNPSVVGSWDVITHTPSGDRPALMVIKQDGGKLAAVAKSPQGERPYDSVALTGSDIKFVMTIQFQGADMILTYTGKIDKDGMKGAVDFGGLAQGEWEAVPHKEMAGSGSGSGTGAGSGSGSGSSSANISGVWNATVVTAQGNGTPEFTIKQDGEKITGKYKGQFGEAPINGTLKGGEISFSMKINAQGQELEVTYTGKVLDGSNMKGKAKLGDFGEADWTAKKQ